MASRSAAAGCGTFSCRRQNVGMLMRMGWSADRARQKSSAMPAAPRTTLTSQGASHGGRRPASAAAREE